MKKCPSCQKTKDYEDFNLSKTRYDGMQPICKICQRIKDKKRYLKNKPSAFVG